MGVISHKGRGREEKDVDGDVDTKVVMHQVQTLDTLIELYASLIEASSLAF